MAKKRIVSVLLTDGTIGTGVIVERPAWNPDRGCHVGFAKVGDRELAVEPVRGLYEVAYRQLGARILPGGRIRGQSPTRPAGAGDAAGAEGV